MFEGGIGEIVFRVATSWQVLACTGALILYMLIVNHVTDRRRPESSSGGLKERVKIRAKVKKAASSLAGPKETEDSGDSNSALGLEEEG